MVLCRYLCVETSILYDRLMNGIERLVVNRGISRFCFKVLTDELTRQACILSGNITPFVHAVSMYLM